VQRWCLSFVVVLLAACPKAGGEYAQSDRDSSNIDTGETNGRMFDFVSNKPDADDWQIRLRGTSLWAAYSNEASTDDLGTKNISNKEAKKAWKLIDKIEIAERKKGKKDEDEGYVELRLREPGGENGHDVFTIYVSRATEDEDVLALAGYLQELVQKYHKEKPNF
jgi:hypothetical protein